MEDLWNIYHSEGYLYFFRSWSNDLRYRAKIEISQRALQVTSLQVAGQVIPNAPHVAALNKADRWLEDDPELPLRQVDFLIKSHMFRFEAPCPLPKSVSDDTGHIGHYVLAEYGRWGGFASHEDTSLYRILSKEMARLPDPLLPIPILQAMDRVARDNSLENRSAP